MGIKQSKAIKTDGMLFKKQALERWRIKDVEYFYNNNVRLRIEHISQQGGTQMIIRQGEDVLFSYIYYNYRLVKKMLKEKGFQLIDETRLTVYPRYIIKW